MADANHRARSRDAKPAASSAPFARGEPVYLLIEDVPWREAA